VDLNITIGNMKANLEKYRVRVMVLNATFNNMSVTSWLSVHW